MATAPPRGFAHVDTWVFDLDNTLYPSSCNLFELIDVRMGTFIAELLSVPYDHARYLQKTYYRQYGTTLAGLMQVHDIEPERFLDHVHDIDYSRVHPSPALKAELQALPGRRLVFTNGSVRHAESVLARLGVADEFEGIFDIVGARYVPKPKAEAYASMVAAHGVDPRCSAMFEDMPHNLEEAHKLGMTTTLIHSSYIDHPSQAKLRPGDTRPAHIDHMTEDIAGFLAEINQARQP